VHLPDLGGRLGGYIVDGGDDVHGKVLVQCRAADVGDGLGSHQPVDDCRRPWCELDADRSVVTGTEVHQRRSGVGQRRGEGVDADAAVVHRHTDGTQPQRAVCVQRARKRDLLGEYHRAPVVRPSL
jgi:hypothetical protein